jgi:hypothetical protein
VSKPQRQENVNVKVAFPYEVESGNATVHDAVGHVFGNVVGPNEEKVDIRVTTERLEDPLTGGLGVYSARFEQIPRRLAEPPLGGEGES